ncbi:acyltransferase [Agromyces allii]|uniref:Acyltransferase n=1 Tax=Agromyces allii TaxID=393607 RepID=A0ABP5C5F3_9MICO|nr:acyltransferase [Agromyces allii]
MAGAEDAASIEPSADVDARARLGRGVRVWHLAQIREHAEIGAGTTIGRGAYVGPGVRIGERCKLQNHALVYEPTVLGDGVFVGPAVVFTNDTHPRAVNPDGSLKGADDWTKVGVVVHDGAAIGARSVCVAPIEIGRWSLVAAGAVVTRDVPDYGLVAGVPARRIGWVGPLGVPLEPLGDGRFRCPSSGALFRETEGVLAPE